MLTLLTVVTLAAVSQSQPPNHDFVQTGVGRYAVFADRASVVRDGSITRMRAFQVTEPDFTAGGVAYWGGWSWWAFDCAAKTADRLDFASVREGGHEGPATPEDAPPYPASPGGDAAELLTIACYPSASPADATTLSDAVTLGRAALAEYRVRDRPGPSATPRDSRRA